MTDWTMNSSSLAKGMLVRRPGLDEALEVVKVQGGQAKIKLPDGKTSTIPASAEVEWSWPTPNDQSLPWGEPRAKNEADSKDAIEATSGQDDTVSDTEWLTDWSLLAAGSKITVLGETGEFTILRKTDSSARIKHNATGQIQTLSIGHKFKFIESEGSASTNDSVKSGRGNADKADRAGKAAKSRTKSKPSAKPDPDPEPDQLVIDDGEPSDDELAAIENGDDETEIGEIENMDDDSEIDPASLRDLDDDDDSVDTADTDDDDNDDNDANDTDTEDDDMPAPASKKTRSTPAPNSTPTPRSTSLLTVGQISERTGISYPTLMRYIRDHSHRLPSEGEGRARRFTPDAIDVFRQIRSETKGGRKPGSSTGSRANSASASARRPKPAPKPNRLTRQERSHETAAPYAAPARKQVAAVAQLVGSPRSQSSAPHSSSIDTLDDMIVSTIDAARVKIAGLEALVENLEAQREQLKLWS